MGDKHHIVNAGGLWRKIPLAVFVGERPGQRICAVEAVPLVRCLRSERICIICHSVVRRVDLRQRRLRIAELNSLIKTNRAVQAAHVLVFVYPVGVEALNGDQAIRKVSISRLGDINRQNSVRSSRCGARKSQ